MAESYTETMTSPQTWGHKATRVGDQTYLSTYVRQYGYLSIASIQESVFGRHHQIRKLHRMSIVVSLQSIVFINFVSKFLQASGYIFWNLFHLIGRNWQIGQFILAFVHSQTQFPLKVTVALPVLRNLVRQFHTFRKCIKRISVGIVRVGFGHHVWVEFCLWAIGLARVVRKIPHFRIGIIWGAIPMSFPVFRISISGRSVSGYGTSPNLWVQKELVKFRQCTQDTWLRYAKFLREFLGYPPFNLLGDLGDVVLG